MKTMIRLSIVATLFLLSGCQTFLTNVEKTLVAGNVVPTPSASAVASTCVPTFDDGQSPVYRPNAPIRSVVGHGHVLTGMVLSSKDCQPIPNAKLEFVPEEAGLGHPDSSRATLFTDQAGTYRFECNPPEHIHMRISASGYRTLFNNSYHPEGKAESTFNIVLRPE